MNLFFPMNPKDLDDWKKVEKLLRSPDWGLQLKRDGVRGILQITSSGIRVFGRKAGKKDKSRPLEMTHNLPTVAGQVLPEFLHGWAFDCEIYHPEKSSAEVAGAVNPNRKAEPVDWESEIEFWVFDCPIIHGEENPYTQVERAFILQLIFAHLTRKDTIGFRKSWKSVDLIKNIFMVETIIDDKESLLRTWMARNEEGGVLKKLDSPYLFSYDMEGKRSTNTWVKAKKEYDGDFVIVGFEPAKEAYTGKKLDTWQYWQAAHGTRKYHGDRDNPQDRPITKYHYYGWIGAIEYGIWMSKGDFKKYSEKNDNMRVISTVRNKCLVSIGTTSGFDELLRVQMSLEPDKYLHQVIKISGMEQLKDTLAVRHPSVDCIRWDKSSEQCEY